MKDLEKKRKAYLKVMYPAEDVNKGTIESTEGRLAVDEPFIPPPKSENKEDLNEQDIDKSKKSKWSFISDFSKVEKVTIVIMLLIGLATVYVQLDAKSENKESSEAIILKLDQLVQPKPYFDLELTAYYASGKQIKDFVEGKYNLDTVDNIENLSDTAIYYFDSITIKNIGDGPAEDVTGDLEYYIPINYIVTLPNKLHFTGVDSGTTTFEFEKYEEIPQRKDINLWIVYESNPEIEDISVRCKLYTKQGLFSARDYSYKRAPFTG